MANHVRIKNSKNLRFKLISLLYLLFISLAIIQIPIEWLRINGPISAYLLKPRIEKIKNPEIRKAHDLIIELNTEFNKLTTDETGRFIEPNEYAKADRFFITEGRGIELHHYLKELADYYSAKQKEPVKKSEFEKLFKEDLLNGLNNSDGTKWAEWKFKHTPSAVVRSLLAELLIRMNLLNGSITVNNKRVDEPILKLAFNTENVHVADTVRFVIRNKIDLKVFINDAGRSFPLNNWLGDTLLFIPQQAGKFELKLERNGEVENFPIIVHPKEFVFNAENGFQTFYEYKKSEIEYSNLPNVGSATCSCDDHLILKKARRVIEFTPHKSGWCKFTIVAVNGRLLLYDSIYIQPVPTPFVFARGSSENRLSLNRLLQTRQIAFMARHPEMPDFEYTIEQLQVRLIGIDNTIKKVNGNVIALNDEQIRKLKYVIVENVKVKTTEKDFELVNQMVFQINN